MSWPPFRLERLGSATEALSGNGGMLEAGIGGRQGNLPCSLVSLGTSPATAACAATVQISCLPAGHLLTSLADGPQPL